MWKFSKCRVTVREQPDQLMSSQHWSITNFFVAQLFHLMYPMGGYRDVADVAFCFMPGVEHQSMLAPVALAPHLKISMLDTWCEYIIRGYKSMSIDTIHQRL
jgi:hypothetical protein